MYADVGADYYLGEAHNLASNTTPDGEAVEDVEREEGRSEKKKTPWNRFWNMGA